MRRERWMNHKRPGLIKSPWMLWEDFVLAKVRMSLTVTQDWKFCLYSVSRPRLVKDQSVGCVQSFGTESTSQRPYEARFDAYCASFGLLNT